MASIDHPCCVRIVAVCMTEQIMLITQLMPLGSLLGYVRNNKHRISSKVMLNWCTQIAKVSAVFNRHVSVLLRVITEYCYMSMVLLTSAIISYIDM